jgi:hypothetical protein
MVIVMHDTMLDFRHGRCCVVSLAHIFQIKQVISEIYALSILINPNGDQEEETKLYKYGCVEL